MPLNRKIALVAWDRQLSGKGTAAATARYGFGLTQGSVLSTEMTQGPTPLTIVDRLPPSVQRTGFQHSVECESLLWPKSAPLLLFGALGSIATTGSSDPFMHTITPAVNLPYLTAFGRLDTEYHRVRDCKVDELTLSWDRRELLRARMRAVGTVAALYQPAFTVTNDESKDQSFFPAGGTFEVETLGSTPALADVIGGELMIRNNLIPIELSRSLEPDDVWPGGHDITFRLRLIPDDTTLWRKIITGSASGTGITQSPVYGSFHLKFQIQASPERSLDIVAGRVAFRGEYPESSPDGGPVELEIEGNVVSPTSGAAITAAIKNDVPASGYNGS
jgi:hypothetical protein